MADHTEVNNIIEILDAYKKGYTIQYMRNGIWVDLKNPSWNFGKNYYRIDPSVEVKPESPIVDQSDIEAILTHLEIVETTWMNVTLRYLEDAEIYKNEVQETRLQLEEIKAIKADLEEA